MSRSCYGIWNECYILFNVNVAESGDNVVVAKQVYGGTTTLVSHTLKRFGIEARF